MRDRLKEPWSESVGTSHAGSMCSTPCPSISPPLQPARPSHAHPRVSQGLPNSKVEGDPSMVQQGGCRGGGREEVSLNPPNLLLPKENGCKRMSACGAQTAIVAALHCAALRSADKAKAPAEPRVAAGARRTAPRQARARAVCAQRRCAAAA